MVVYADTDFAGCTATRRSTSGGCALWAGMLVKHWSTTQKAITLSSGEAELGGVVKAASEALGLQSVAHDLGAWGLPCARTARLQWVSAAAPALGEFGILR